MPTAQEILKQYFGYDSFRPGQDELVQAILSGRDTLGIMPTGAGKSICYQVPALALPGLTLVISPLISLMKDQVGALNEAGVPAACINSALSFEEMRDALYFAGRGEYKLLYVAPERLTAPFFLDFARRVPISMVTVDEAHCISQWGQDFRPSYLKILDFLAALPQRPLVSAFTATATAEVRDDIIRALGLEDPFVITTGFDRPNLYFAVEKPSSKPSALLAHLLQRRDKSGIVYCSTRKTVEEVCDMLLSRATTPVSTPRSSSPIRTTSCTPARPSWSRPTPSAWASTSPTSRSSFTIICRRTWKAIIRRPDALDATAKRRTASCCTTGRMCVLRNFSSSTATRMTTTPSTRKRAASLSSAIWSASVR